MPRRRKQQSGSGAVPADILDWDAAPAKGLAAKVTNQQGMSRKEKQQQQLYMKLGGVALLILLFFAYGWGARAREVTSWASSHGYNVVNATDYNIRHKFEQFGIFGRGVDDYGQSVVEGTKGDYAFTSFDYAYTRAAVVRGKKKARVQRFEDIVITCAVIGVPNRKFPTLTVRPTAYVAEWDYLRQLNISLPSEEQAKDFDKETLRRFSEAYAVKTIVKDNRVFEVLNSDVMGLINSAPAQFVYEFTGNKLMVYQEHVVDSSMFDGMIDAGIAVIEKMEDVKLPELTDDIPQEQEQEQEEQPAEEEAAEEPVEEAEEQDED